MMKNYIQKDYEAVVPSKTDNATTDPARCTTEQPQCLLGPCGFFRSRSCLTKHFWRLHKEEVGKPFFCPECKKLGKEDGKVEAGAQAWSSHAARCHGKINAPNMDDRTSYCHLCEGSFTAGGFNAHVTTKHVRTGKFENPFSCPACHKDGNETMIVDFDGWTEHVKHVHGTKENPLKRKMREEESAGLPTKTHQKRRKTSAKAATYENGVQEEEKGHSTETGEDNFEWDWAVESPGSHADEEFWVDGRY